MIVAKLLQLSFFHDSFSFSLEHAKVLDVISWGGSWREPTNLAGMLTMFTKKKFLFFQPNIIP